MENTNHLWLFKSKRIIQTTKGVLCRPQITKTSALHKELLAFILTRIMKPALQRDCNERCKHF